MMAPGTPSASIFGRDGVQVGRPARQPSRAGWFLDLRLAKPADPARPDGAGPDRSVDPGPRRPRALQPFFRHSQPTGRHPGPDPGYHRASRKRPTDLFSDLPAAMANSLRQVPGVRVVAPQVWKIAPSIEGRSLFARSAADLLTRPGNEPLKGLLNMVQIEGQDIAEHARLRSDVYRNRLLPPDQGGGRFLDESDRGRPNIVISIDDRPGIFPTHQGSREKSAVRSGSAARISRSSGFTARDRRYSITPSSWTSPRPASS